MSHEESVTQMSCIPTTLWALPKGRGTEGSKFFHACCLSKHNGPQADLFFLPPLESGHKGFTCKHTDWLEKTEKWEISQLCQVTHTSCPTSPASCLSCRCIFKGCFPASNGEVERVQFFLPSLLQSNPWVRGRQVWNVISKQLDYDFALVPIIEDEAYSPTISLLFLQMKSRHNGRWDVQISSSWINCN